MVTTNTSRWKPPFVDWDRVHLDAYRLIYQEGKECFEDVLSETESITNKGLKVVAALAAFLGIFLGHAIKHPPQPWLIGLFLGLAVANCLFLTLIIFPRKSSNRGERPAELIPPDLDKQEPSDHHAAMYYHAIVMLQEKIERVVDSNENRATYYKVSLLLTFITVISIATYITYSL